MQGSLRCFVQFDCRCLWNPRGCSITSHHPMSTTTHPSSVHLSKNNEMRGTAQSPTPKLSSDTAQVSNALHTLHTAHSSPPTMAPSRIRLGTASPGTQPPTAETLAQLEGLARQAASKNIDILLLPEAYIGGYPRGTHFGCLIGSRSDEGREEYLRYFQSAVDLGDTVGDGAGAGQAWVNRELPSDAVSGSDGGKELLNKRGDGTREELERIARDNQMFIVVGLIEKAGGSMYCSVVYVCPDLGIIGKRRKVMPVSAPPLGTIGLF